MNAFSTQNEPYLNLSPLALSLEMASGEPMVIVDVRNDWEYDGRHIPGALLIPLDQLGSRASQELKTDTPIVCVCEHGVRSAAAARFLVASGYTNISHLVGGMADWDGETESGSQ